VKFGLKDGRGCLMQFTGCRDGGWHVGQGGRLLTSAAVRGTFCGICLVLLLSDVGVD